MTATTLHRPPTWMSPAEREQLEAAARTSPEARILARASELLIRDGWCQGQSLDDQGRRCLIGAICTAGQEVAPGASHHPCQSAQEWVADVLCDRGLSGHLDHFNDADGRSLDDVLDVLAAARAAIGGARA